MSARPEPRGNEPDSPPAWLKSVIVHFGAPGMFTSFGKPALASVAPGAVIAAVPGTTPGACKASAWSPQAWEQRNEVLDWICNGRLARAVDVARVIESGRLPVHLRRRRGRRRTKRQPMLRG